MVRGENPPAEIVHVAVETGCSDLLEIGKSFVNHVRVYTGLAQQGKIFILVMRPDSTVVVVPLAVFGPDAKLHALHLGCPVQCGLDPVVKAQRPGQRDRKISSEKRRGYCHCIRTGNPAVSVAPEQADSVAGSGLVYAHVPEQNLSRLHDIVRRVFTLLADFDVSYLCGPGGREERNEKKQD